METTNESKAYTLIKRNSFVIETEDIKDRVLLLITVNSKDERAKDVFAILTKLNKKFDTSRFRILCFPCSQFGAAVTRQDVANFERQWGFNVGAILDSIDVKGHNASDLFRYLKEKTPSPLGNAITENFTMWLIDQKGEVRKRLPALTSFLALDHFILQYMSM